MFLILKYDLFHLSFINWTPFPIKMKMSLDLRKLKDFLHKHNEQDKILLSYELMTGQNLLSRYQKSFLSILFGKIRLNQTKKGHHFNFAIYQN